MVKKDEQKSNAPGAATGTSFAQMTTGGKIRHVGKVILFFLSFGFAFPNIFSD